MFSEALCRDLKAITRSKPMLGDNLVKALITLGVSIRDTMTIDSSIKEAILRQDVNTNNGSRSPVTYCTTIAEAIYGVRNTTE